MAFVGKLAYLFLFPGACFILLAGTLTRVVHRWASAFFPGAESEAPAGGLSAQIRALPAGYAAIDDALQAVPWIAPNLRIFALSWISCVVLGFLPGDLVLVLFLLLLSATSGLLFEFPASDEDEERILRTAVFRVTGWAVPFCLAFSGVALRTGEVTVSRVIQWQVLNGAVIGSTAGGGTALAGSALLFVAAFLTAGSVPLMLPLGGGPGRSRVEAGGTDGAPRAVNGMADTATLFVTPLVLTALFLGGPADTWYQMLIWALKVLAVSAAPLLLYLPCMRADKTRSSARIAGAATLLAATGISLVWAGVAV